MKKTQTRFKFLAFFLAAVLLLGAMSLTITAADDTDTLYSANINPELDSIFINNTASFGGIIVNPKVLPTELIVRKITSSYYYVTNTDWPTEYDEYRYILADKLVNIQVLETTLETQIGAFNVAVDGAIPSDAKLTASAISKENVDPGIFERQDVNMKSFIAAFDLKIKQGESQWQPTEDNPVTVTMNAAALGLYTGQEVYIIHMHENADGTKEYEILGPTYVASGKFSFETKRFSTFAIYKGEGAVALPMQNTTESHKIYIEPGSKVTLLGATNSTGTQGTATSLSGSLTGDTTITLADGSTKAVITTGTARLPAECGGGNAVQIIVDSAAPINSIAKCTVTWEAGGFFGFGATTYTASVEIIVSSRETVTEEALKNYSLVVAIRKPDANGKFPTEPTADPYYSSEYFFFEYTDAQPYTISDTTINEDNAENVPRYSEKAAVYLNPDVMSGSFGWMYDAEGKAVGGVIDPLGVYTKQCFNTGDNAATTDITERTIDWEAMALAIAQYNDTQRGDVTDATQIGTMVTNGTVVAVRYNQEINGSFEDYAIVLTADPSKTIASYNGVVSQNALVYYEEFNLIPYVIKLITTEAKADWFVSSASSSKWHVDIALVRGDSYTLSYDLNIRTDVYVDGTTLALPDAQVFVEDPSDTDTTVTYTFATTDQPNVLTNIKVVSFETGLSATMNFLGWYDQKTLADPKNNMDVLYGPGNAKTTITFEGNKKLYAIWEIVGTLGVDKSDISIDKQVSLAPGSPIGSVIPTINGANKADFSYFDFTINIGYDPAKIVPQTAGDVTYKATVDYLRSEIVIEAAKLGSDGVLTGVSGTTDLPLTLENLRTKQVTLDWVTVNETDGKVVSITFRLANQEWVKFVNAPIMEDESYNQYIVTESIPAEAKRYSITNDTQTITLTEAADSMATFNNIYTPPVAGLTISASGSDGEFFVFEILQGTASWTTVVVPANGEVTVTGLLAQEGITYIVREKSTGEAWSWRWGAMTEQNVPAFDSAGNAAVAFAPDSVNNKWLFGNSRSFVTVTN